MILKLLLLEDQSCSKVLIKMAYRLLDRLVEVGNLKPGQSIEASGLWGFIGTDDQLRLNDYDQPMQITLIRVQHPSPKEVERSRRYHELGIRSIGRGRPPRPPPKINPEDITYSQVLRIIPLNQNYGDLRLIPRSKHILSYRTDQLLEYLEREIYPVTIPDNISQQKHWLAQQLFEHLRKNNRIIYLRKGG